LETREGENLYESPCWDHKRKCTWFVNVHMGILHKFDRGHVEDIIKFDHIITSVNLCSSGRLILTSKDQILLFDPDSSYIKIIYTFHFENEHFRLNDCKVSPAGELIFSFFEDVKPRRLKGSVGVFSLPKNIRMLYLNQFLTPIGLVVDSKRNLLWISDTGKAVIYQLELTNKLAGSLKLGKEVKSTILIDSGFGRPDGGNLDILGNYWVALHEGSQIGVWDPNGKALCQFVLTQSKPTMLCFAGDDLNRIDVTYKVNNLMNKKSVSINSLAAKFSGVMNFQFRD